MTAIMKAMGEGGSCGMALPAAYMLRRDDGGSLEDHLDSKV